MHKEQSRMTGRRCAPTARPWPHGAGVSSPDVEMQARLLRDGRFVLAASPTKLPADTTKDLSRLPYWSEMDLGQLAPGRYTLLVTATDRATRGSAMAAWIPSPTSS